MLNSLIRNDLPHEYATETRAVFAELERQNKIIGARMARPDRSP